MPRFAMEVGLSAEQAAQLISVQGISNMCGRVGLGLLVDAFPARKADALRFVAALMTCAYLSLALAAAGLVDPLIAFAFMACSGLFGGSLVSLQPSIVVEMLGEASLPLGQGLFNLSQAPFALMGPPIGGALRSASGSYVAVWVFTTCMCGYAACSTQLMMRPALRTKVFSACGRRVSS